MRTAVSNYLNVLRSALASIDPSTGKVSDEEVAALVEATDALTAARLDGRLPQGEHPLFAELGAAREVAQALGSAGWGMELEDVDVSVLVEALRTLDPEGRSGIASTVKRRAAPSPNVTVKHYDLQFDLRQAPHADTYPAVATLTLDAPAARTAIVDFDPSRLTLGRVDAKVNGAFREVRAEVRQGRLVISAPGATQVRVRYQALAKEAGSDVFGLMKAVDANGRYLLHTDLWTDRSDALFPSVVNPDDGATVSIDVQGPEGATVIEGDLAAKVPAYNASFYVSNQLVKKEGQRTEDGVSVSLYTRDTGTENDVLESSKDAALATATFSLNYLAKYFGPWRFGTEARLIEWAIPDYSLENPTAVGMMRDDLNGDIQMKSSIAHELIHDYFGNAVRFANWDLWISEGITNYLQGRILDAMEGPEAARADDAIQLGYLREAYTGTTPRDASLSTPGHVDFWSGPRSTSYQVGTCLLRMMEYRVGREAFDAALQTFYRAYDGRAASSADFLKHMQEHTGQDFSAYFGALNALKSIPRATLAMSTAGDAATVTVTPQSYIPAGLEVPVRFVGPNGETVDRMVNLSLAWEAQTFEGLGFTPMSFVIDPTHILFDDLTIEEKKVAAA
jgi:aminopeptidase N